MDEALLNNLLAAYGPFAVFLLLMLSAFGLALSEEMVIVPAGIFVSTGQLSLIPTALCAYAGVVASDLIWFAICHHYGTPLLHRRWMKRLVHPRRLLEAKHQLERRGAWLVVMARFIPSGRTTTITVAGIFHMPFWKFALATASCVLLTVPIQLGLGYLIGQGIGTEDKASLLLRTIGVVAALGALSMLIGWWSTHKTGTRRPRARAAWLRRFRPKTASQDPSPPAPSAGSSPEERNGPRVPKAVEAKPAKQAVV